MAEMTTIQLPASVRDRLAKLKQHPRQPYHEIIAAALDAYEKGRRVSVSAKAS